MLINPKQPVIRQIKDGEYEYQADLYDSKVYFNDPKEGEYNHLFKIIKNGNELIFKMLNAIPSELTIDADNKLTYHNMFDGVDVVYTLYPEKVKEDIIIKSYESEHTFRFRAYESLQSTLNDNGDIIYVDTDNDNQQIFELPAPYAIDANNKSVEVEMIHEGGYYTYKVIPNNDTTYPIVLDPTIDMSVRSYLCESSVTSYEEKTVSDSSSMMLPENTEGYTITFVYNGKQGSAGALTKHTGKIEIVDKNNRILETYNGDHENQEFSVKITKDMRKINFYTTATDQKNCMVTSNIYISKIDYDTYDEIFFVEPKNYINYSNYKYQITSTPTKILIGRNNSFGSSIVPYDKCTMFIFAKNNQNVTINNIYCDTGSGTTKVQNGEFSYGRNSIVYAELSSTQNTNLEFVAFINSKSKGKQESQILSLFENIIGDESEALEINEKISEISHSNLNVNESIGYGGNDTIHIKENIYIGKKADLPIKITLDDVTKYVELIYTSNPDNAIEYICSDTSFNKYIRVIGFKVSAKSTFSYRYYNYLGEKINGNLTSAKGFEVIDTNGIAKLYFYNNDIIIDKFELIIDNLQPEFIPLYIFKDNSRYVADGDMVIKIVGYDINIYEVKDPSKTSNLSSNLIDITTTDKVILKKDQTYYIKRNLGQSGSSSVGCIFRYDNMVVDRFTFAIKENIGDGSNFDIIENVYAADKNDFTISERITNDNEYQYININENVYINEDSTLPLAEKAYISNNRSIDNKEKVYATDKNVFDIKEAINDNSSNVFDIIEKIYIKDKNDLLLLEKTILDSNSSSINIEEFIHASDKNTLNIIENILAVCSLSVSEKIFNSSSNSLPIAEGAITNNNSLIRILETIKNSSKDQLNIIERIASKGGNENLDLKELIPTSDEAVINVVESIINYGYKITPIKEKIIISDVNKAELIETVCLGQSDNLNLNEIILGKTSEGLVLLEEVKISGNDTVSIIENVKPVSLTIIENVSIEVDYATRLITFTKPTFKYKKG